MKDVFNKIVADPQLEARWLNTLSLLEHTGAQKISKTVCSDHPSIEIMEHRADETRHAYVFAKLGHQLDSKHRDYLCYDHALSYFHMLDQNISDWMTELTGEENSYYNYLLVTYMIEKRAMKLYPVYSKATHQTEVKNALNDIIHEESGHLQMMEKALLDILKKYSIKSSDGLKPCFQIEETLFDAFYRSLVRDVDMFAKAA